MGESFGGEPRQERTGILNVWDCTENVEGAGCSFETLLCECHGNRILTTAACSSTLYWSRNPVPPHSRAPTRP